MRERRLRLFEVFGIELEYVIVDRRTLCVLPLADKVLHSLAGDYVSEVQVGDLCWQNELALHVIEVKVPNPVPSLENLSQTFQDSVSRMNERLQALGAQLMPTGMHPWMDPVSETRLWPHEYRLVYETFDRIFDCRTHGWANLQSVHLNLPFRDDLEFGRLHAAVRLLIPIMPALAASSPVLEGRLTGILDNRLDVYRTHAHRVPSVSGRVIPEAVFSRQEYEEQILKRIYRDIAPYDEKGVLQHEWMNSRGAIARFERNTIEVRVLDMQECPRADLAICQTIVGVLQALVAQHWADWETQKSFATEALQAIFQDVIGQAEQARIRNSAYLEALGYRHRSAPTAQELWQHLAESLFSRDSSCRPVLEFILGKGSLARRIAQALESDVSRSRLQSVYRRLCQCLEEGELFG